jgi:3-hydroxypropanoate dehydrogenase
VTDALDDKALNLIFREARTHNKWRDEPVPEELLRQVWELARMGPTSANCSPARIHFVVTPQAKAKLKPCLMEGNVEKTMAAPATAIIGFDEEFHERLPVLFPHTDARSWFAGEKKAAHRHETAFRNGTLQGAYFIIAARALGLDCGPMSGFSQKKVNEAFFADTTIKANFLCNVGYGDPAGLRPRSPRLDFGEACAIL